ncbi:uncharacterized protein IL334_001196 [Kwoniella shivajii]|uniref:Uncharacterized protein n=1 Tax=Kwoniella shivajii TaxID=564305 RepID=A0ABZ1CSU6_9TREE|nr:hypothetical protein IL334_001196 [Kwoniella shivajii]
MSLSPATASVSRRLSSSHRLSRGFVTSIASSSTSTGDLASAAVRDYAEKQHPSDISKPSRRSGPSAYSTSRSLVYQADKDLTVDLNKARSHNEYKRRFRSGAPSLSISAATKDDLPQRGRTKGAKQPDLDLASHQNHAVRQHDRRHKAIPPDGANKLLLDVNENEIEEVLRDKHPHDNRSEDKKWSQSDSGVISARKVIINEVKPPREMKIARLRRSLGRVLFSPGVLPLRDVRTGVWNFEPSLHDIPQPEKFAFNRCPPYITPSQDEELLELAKHHECRFIGSTSTLTKALSQIYFAISGGKGVDLSPLSQDFASEVNSLLMRSQLDCYDPRLPGNGVFDIKTRACLPIRHDRANYLANSDYDIWRERGYTQSYEREYYDLLRAGMLNLQVRIGGMDGIFLAYHNTSRLFGFQYISLTEIDQRIFGSTEMANQAFKLSVSLLEELLHRCVAAFPDQAVNVILKHSPATHANSVTAYVEPKEWDAADKPRPVQAITLTMENLLDDEVARGPVGFSVDDNVRQNQNWTVRYALSTSSMDEEGQVKARKGLHRLQQDLLAMNSLSVPAGQSVKSMARRDQITRREEQIAQRNEKQHQEEHPSDEPSSSSDSVANAQFFTKIKWREPGPRQILLREEAKESGRAYEKRKRTWKKGKYAWAS